MRSWLYNLAFYAFMLVLFAGQDVKGQGSGSQPQASPTSYEPYINNPPGLEEERRKLMYPYERKDMLQLSIVRPVHDQALRCRLPFFGFFYHYMLVHKDGYITFNRGLVAYDFPIKFPIQITNPDREEDPSIIAPWLTQQEVPRNLDEAGVYFRVIEVDKENNQTLKERIYRDFREGMIGAAEFNPKYVIIVTWKNVSFANPQPSKPLRTNTYQAVLATDEMHTYAMFNYEWISWITHMDNFEGQNGPQAFVGFNAGNGTRAFEFRPYSQHPHVNLLPERGFANGLNGRFMFQIDEEIWFGSCIERELDPNWNDRPLTFFPRYGSMLGGTLVNITGPCLGSLGNKKKIIVKFDFINVECSVRGPNHATCISPPLMYHGYIDIATGLDEKSFFYHGKWYIQPPEITEDRILLSGDKDREEDPDQLDLSWRAKDLAWHQNAQVQLHLWGYRETDSYPALTHITKLATGINIADERYMLQVRQFHGNTDYGKQDLTFGFISMNLTEARDALGMELDISPVLWSRPMPLAWYFKRQWDREYGTDKWKHKYCDAWYQKELNSDRFAHTNFRCPCTLQQAELDRGSYAPDVQCNIIDRNCDTFHQGAHHCIMSGRPAVGGAGQTCCYDDHGELMQTADTMYGGRPARAFKFGKHPYKQRMMVPSLSNWMHDMVPFFFCCKWHQDNDNSDTCAMYKYWRTSQDCSSYSSPGVASVYGDPHILTFDRLNYTFNGKGEFVLSRVHDAVHKLNVQARFEQIPKAHWLDPLINATALTAVSMRDNQSSIVEFRLRPIAARWRYHFYVIVDKEYVFFWDDSLRIQHFRGVTLYQPAGTWNMSHIVAMFDSGAGIEVHSGNGYMSAHVYLPYTFMNKTKGLLGNWSGHKEDDFTGVDGFVSLYPGASAREIYDLFGSQYRLADTDQPNLGSSLFYHDTVPFSVYDGPNFQPELREPLMIPDNFTFSKEEVDQICSNSVPCRYDFIVTKNPEWAKSTKSQESAADQLSIAVREDVVRCHALPKPLYGRKSEIRYFIGSVVRFSCDDGYRLTGTEVRRCRENGLWSWGFEAECVGEASYRGKIGGIAVGILIPILICGVFIGICFVRWRRHSNHHYTGEEGMGERTLIELKKRDSGDYVRRPGKLETDA